MNENSHEWPDAGGKVNRAVADHRTTARRPGGNQPSIADRMAILDRGRILQVGSPREVYRRPSCKLVADFIGETDFIDGTLVGAIL